MKPETTIVTTFADKKIAGAAIEAFRNEGFQDREVEILQGAGDALKGELAKRGFGENDVRGFVEAVGRGMALVAARVTADEAEKAAAVLDRFEASPAGNRPGETVEIVEETLSVNKPKVATGGVRVTSKVNERPVEESVTLREERVGTEQRAADRTLTADEAKGAFKEKTVEMIGTREEAEVHKEARVIGEVAVTKDVKEHEETVRDTLRSTDVKVEEVAGASKRK